MFRGYQVEKHCFFRLSNLVKIRIKHIPVFQNYKDVSIPVNLRTMNSEALEQIKKKADVAKLKKSFIRSLLNLTNDKVI